MFNPLNAELNPICHLLALLGVHHFLHVSRIRVNQYRWDDQRTEEGPDKPRTTCRILIWEPEVPGQNAKNQIPRTWRNIDYLCFVEPTLYALDIFFTRCQFCNMFRQTTVPSSGTPCCRYRNAFEWFVVQFVCLFVCFWRNSPQWARASSFTRFLDHTQRRTTVGRTPLGKGSSRRRYLYLTTHNTHNRHPCPRWNSNPQSQQASCRGPTP